MKRRLISTKRQKRQLVIPKPGRKGNIKITREGWLNCARVALIEDGIDGVKVDRLAKRLKVTRGGFYYHFRNHHQVLQELLALWRNQNRFTPAKVDVSTPAAAARAVDRITDDLIHESGFDPQFDMAVREWARISHPVADVVHEVDEQRVEVIRQIFLGLGYAPVEALIRARIFYWHQVGYYAVGFREALGERERNARIYLDVLAGDKYRKAAA
jgi:AcrR family transcriptional regulator